MRYFLVVCVALIAGCAAPRKPLPIDPTPAMSQRFGGGAAGPSGGDVTVLAEVPSAQNFLLKWSCAPSSTTPDMVFEVRASAGLGPKLSWTIAATVPANPSSANYSYALTNDWGAQRFFTVTASNFTGRPNVISGTAITAAPGAPAWPLHFGSTQTDYGTCVAVDPSGNIVVGGIFSETVNFGGVPLTSAGGYDIFVAKYSPAGSHLWSKQFGGASSEIVKCLALDVAGNVFLGGTVPGGSLMKLDSSGNLLWTRGPPLKAAFASVATDSLGNAICTGSFEALWPGIDFGNGHMADSVNGGTDAFMAKYSPSGSNTWVKVFGSGDTEYGTSVAIHTNNDSIFLTGYAFTGINLGCGGLNNGSASYGAFGFLGEFTPGGTCVWSQACGTIGSGGTFSRARLVAVDIFGDVVLVGEYQNRTDLAGQPQDGGEHAIFNGPSNFWDMYLAKYSGVDGHFLLGKRITGELDCSPTGLGVDPSNDIVVSGTFRATVNFGGQSLTTAGFRDAYDVFVASDTPTGALLWAKRSGGVSGDYGNGGTVDAAGHAIATGAFSGVATFGDQLLTSAGGFDVFLIRLDP